MVKWRKALIIVLDLSIAVYLVLAITAFNKPDDKATVCTEVKINIIKNGLDGFLTNDEVKNMLQQEHLYPVAMPMKLVNTRAIEENLERSPYIERVECYKTQNGHICINLDQRMPVMRIMADNGENYYLDSEGIILPDTRYTNNVVVASGNITKTYASKSLTPLGNIISNDKFWQSQVVQVNVLSDKTVELVPRVGNHIVYLGEPVKLKKKLERLRKFYKYGLNKAGWNKYSRINVEFDNQIICKKAEFEKMRD